MEFESSRENDRVETGLLRYDSVEGHRAELPLAIVKPDREATGAVVWIDGQGKAALFDSNGNPNASVRKLTASGRLVIGVDLLSQGEFNEDGKSILRNRWLPDEEAFASWTYAYNLPLFARRTHDILATLAFARQIESRSGSGSIALVGFNGSGPLAAAALSIAGESIDRAAIDTGGFRFARLDDIHDAEFIPGSVKYGDLPGLLSLAAPTGLWLGGEDNESAGMVRSAFEAAGKPDRLILFTGEKSELKNSAIEWLTKD